MGICKTSIIHSNESYDVYMHNNHPRTIRYFSNNCDKYLFAAVCTMILSNFVFHQNIYRNSYNIYSNAISFCLRYFDYSLCITLTTIKACDMKRVELHLVLIYHVLQAIHHAPAFCLSTIMCNCLLLSFFKEYLHGFGLHTNKPLFTEPTAPT